jgi:hypothetical protein
MIIICSTNPKNLFSSSIRIPQQTLECKLSSCRCKQMEMKKKRGWLKSNMIHSWNCKPKNQQFLDNNFRIQTARKGKKKQNKRSNIYERSVIERDQTRC